MKQVILKTKQLSKKLAWRRICTTIPLQCLQRKESIDTFQNAFPEVIETLTRRHWCHNSLEFEKHYKELIEYTVGKDKRMRNSLVIDAYKSMESAKNFSKEKLHLITMYAWSMELIHTAMIVHDDSFDRAETRGNDICWYRKPNVGVTSGNDGTLLYAGAFALLKKYFSSLKIYPDLVETMQHMILSTATGQVMNCQHKQDGKIIYERINTHWYNTLTRYKMARAVEGPFKGVLIMTDNLHFLRGLTNLFNEFGIVFQSDNDILDVYTKNGEVREIIGDDISEGAVTWPAVQILNSDNKEMIKAFKQNYGKREPECEREVVKIFEEFRMFDKYCEYIRAATNKMFEKSERELSPKIQQTMLHTINNLLPHLTKL